MNCSNSQHPIKQKYQKNTMCIQIELHKKPDVTYEIEGGKDNRNKDYLRNCKDVTK